MANEITITFQDGPLVIDLQAVSITLPAQDGTLLRHLEDRIDALETTLSSSVRTDAAQSLTAAQMSRARSNIAALGTEDLGDLETDFVSLFESGLD